MRQRVRSSLHGKYRFDHIREIRPSAADLLSLMSFFDRQGIPEALLRSRGGQSNYLEDQQESTDGDFKSDEHGDDDEDSALQSSMKCWSLDDDILALQSYSFISINADGTTFEMHGLVQLATRKWLEREQDS